LPVKVRCSCVEFAKYVTGHSGETWGNASRMRPSHLTPVVGDVVIFDGHVAVITDIKGDTLRIIEANYVSCKVTTREVDVSDPSIIGYR
jgi:surface antigen